MVLIICAHGTSLPPYVKNLHANMHVSRGSQEKLSETYQSRGRNQYAETSPGTMQRRPPSRNRDRSMQRDNRPTEGRNRTAGTRRHQDSPPRVRAHQP